MITLTELKGAPVAEALNVKTRNLLRGARTTPCLAIVSVGDDAASAVYVRQKLKAAEALGLRAEHIHLGEAATYGEVESTIKELAAHPNVTAIVLQLPLPESLVPLTDSLLALIPPTKDPDCLGPHPASLLAPATPTGIMALLDHYHIELEGANVVLIGRSRLVGKPLIPLLLARNCTLTICHSHTKDLALHTQTADIIISAVGRPGLITSHHVGKCGPQVLIDVGITRTPDGNLKGDFDISDIKAHSLCDISYTPTPGGTGPLTVASLMYNTAYLSL